MKIKAAGVSSQQLYNNINTKTPNYKEECNKIMEDCGLKLDARIMADGSVRLGSGGRYIAYELPHPIKSYSLLLCFFIREDDTTKLYSFKPEQKGLSPKQRNKLKRKIHGLKDAAIKKLKLNPGNIEEVDVIKKRNEKLKQQSKKTTHKNICSNKKSFKGSVGLEILEAECISEMTKAGLVVERLTINDNYNDNGDNSRNWIRVPTEDKPFKRNGFYIAKSGISAKGNSYLMCSYGNWKNRENALCYKSWEREGCVFDKEELKDVKRQLQEHQEQVAREAKDKYDKVAKKAQQIYEEATKQAPSEKYLAYLKIKHISATQGVKYGTNPNKYPAIIIPLKNIHDEIRTLQFISVEANKIVYKTFLAGGEKRGNFFVIGKIRDGSLIYVVEGYATGASIYEATSCCVVVAIDKGNLDPVIKNIKEKYPHNQIVIAGDHDVNKEGINYGKDAAFAAAKKYGCDIVMPAPIGDKSTDFNDIHQHPDFGLKEVKRQLNENVEKVLTYKDELHKLISELLKIEDPCDSFSISSLPPVLREFVSVKSKITDAHKIMIALSAIVTISAFLGKRVLLPKTYYYQDLYPNIWTLCVASSGLHKSTALNSGAVLALNKQEEIYKEIKNLKENLPEEDNDEKAEIEEEIRIKKLENVVLPQRTTGEAFIKLLGEGRTGTMYINELGPWLQNQQKKYNSDFRGTLTDLYDVPKIWENTTKTQGVDILEEPCFSICAVSAPTWIRDNIKIDDIHSGFFARWLIYVPPKSNKMSSGLPNRVDNSLAEGVEKIFKEWLYNTLKIIGEKKLFKISEEAKKIFNNKDTDQGKLGLHQQIEKIVQSYPNHEILEPYFKRWSPTLLKLAMIMQLLIDPKKDEIGTEAIYSAFSLIIPAIKSTAYLLKNVLGENLHERRCKELMKMILNFLKRKDLTFITRQQILQWAKNINCLNGGIKVIDPVIETLVARGELEANENVKRGKNSWQYSPQKVEDL